MKQKFEVGDLVVRNWYPKIEYTESEQLQSSLKSQNGELAIVIECLNDDFYRVFVQETGYFSNWDADFILKA